MKKVFGIAALLLAFAACNKEETEGIVITATLAPKTAVTKAVADGGDSKITVTWARNEKIAILYEVSGNKYVAEANIDSVDGSTGAAVISFTVENGTADNTACTLVYPARLTDGTTTVYNDALSGVKDAAALLSAQDGTLSADLDVRVGTGIIQTTTPGLDVTAQPAAQFAIFKFTVKHAYTSAAIDVKPLTVTIGTDNFVITPSSATSALYAALPAVSGQAVSFSATGGSKTYTCSKDDVTFAAGRYYQSTLKMAAEGEVAPPHTVRARPNKYSMMWGTYKAVTVDRVAGFTASEEPQLDAYGGWKGESFEATGYFRVQQNGDRWWLVTPEGNLYISKGVEAFSSGGSERKIKALTDKFGTTEAWAEAETAMLKENGFNSIGAWSSVGTVRNLSVKTPYMVMLSPMRSYNNEVKQQWPDAEYGWEGYPEDFAFVFDEGFDKKVEEVLKEAAVYADDPYCIGYFIDNEIPWKQYALDRCLQKFPSDHINHIKAQQWLDEREQKTGATIADVNDSDREAFIAYCLETYLQKVTTVLRKYDTNHLFLGCRFNQWFYELQNEEIFKVAGKYMDVISVNHYQKWQPDQQAISNWATWSGKPFMVTEFYTKGEDSGMGNTTGAGWIVQTQADRGYFYQNFVLELLKSKVCVGWNWFTYIDNDPEDPTADSSNLDSNKGIVNYYFEPYSPLLENMNAINHQVLQLIHFFDQ